MANRVRIVPKGRAAVDSWDTATVLRKANTIKRGPGNKMALSVVFHTQLVPPIWSTFLLTRSHQCPT